jgi:class 3 adenylate cyclase
MNDLTVKRTLAAIVVADVVGYSRMMGEDEAGTLGRLTRYRGEFIDTTIAEHSATHRLQRPSVSHFAWA